MADFEINFSPHLEIFLPTMWRNGAHVSGKIVENCMIYVSELFSMASKIGNKYSENLWCRMWTDGDREELHAFALRVFAPTHSTILWHYFNSHAIEPHYTLIRYRRTKALELGAIEWTAADNWQTEREATGNPRP